MKKFILLCFLISGSITVTNAQQLDSLKVLINKIQKGENDSIRIAANKAFYTGVEKLLKDSNSFDATYDSLKNISVLSPDDHAFRIYTWVLPYFDGSKYEYYGFLQYKSGKLKDSITLLPLIDSTSTIVKPESEKLTPAKWLGSVYYSVQMVEKSKVKYYCLFGWKGKNEKETQKLIEVLYFKKDKPQFGYPLFKIESVYKNRMLFTYSAQATMTLRYEKNFGGIVFDHIASSKNNPGVITGPDGTFDAFKWRKGKWQMYRDVDTRTKWKPAEILPDPPEK